jgi:hypothetical protein
MTASQVPPATDTIHVLAAAEVDELVDAVNTSIATLRTALPKLYFGRAWVAAGLPDWESFCMARFGGVQFPRLDRADAVIELRAEGMSLRAIASGLGVSKDTVARDLAPAVSNETPPMMTREEAEQSTVRAQQSIEALGTELPWLVDFAREHGWSGPGATEMLHDLVLRAPERSALDATPFGQFLSWSTALCDRIFASSSGTPDELLRRALVRHGIRSVHPALEAIPLATAAELDGMADSARDVGWIMPIVVTSDEVLLDGRNRLIAEVASGRAIAVKRLDPPDPIAYVFGENLRRQHLTEGQRAMIAVGFEKLFAADEVDR